MPSTIPYDPSLVLANVVDNEAIRTVEEISKAQAPADAAQENLNSLLASRRSLDMTKTELMNLGIETDELTKAVEDLNADIAKSAATYATAKATAEGVIQPLRSKIQSVHASVESPVDYVKSTIRSLPLASNSISMDVQYFSRDRNDQNSSSFAGRVSSFVSASTSWMGPKASSQVSTAATQQVSAQMQSHCIQGTLVLSVSCTHKNAAVLAPLILNVDKGIKVWNHLFPDDKLIPTNRGEMVALANSEDPEGKNKFSIISGMTFGSSFVGMVHVLNSTTTNASEALSSYASSLQTKMQWGSWLSNASGGFGVDSSISNDVKNLLSTQDITSHVTMVCMGVIPSVVANDVQMGVKEFASFDPQASMEAIAAVSNATVNNQESVKASADAARTGQKMLAIKSSDMKAALSALKDIKDGSNKILDINSMMTALDDYLKKAAAGESGVPINYYLKDITKEMLAEMWVAKYYPGEYMVIKSDDSEGAVGTAAVTASA